MEDDREKTRPVPVPPRTDAAPKTRVPNLFVGEGGERISVIAPELPGARSPEELARSRDRRRHQQEIEKLREEAELASGLRRIRNAVLLVVTILAVALGIWWLNQTWHGQWPILFTWLVMSAAILVGFGWVLWYLQNGD